MAQAPRDNNRVPTLIGVSSADGVTPVVIKIDSVTNRVFAEIASTAAQGAVTNREIAYRDNNHTPVALGLSSSDQTTLVMPVVDSPGYLRITT